MSIPILPVKYNFELLRGTDYTFQAKIQNCDGTKVTLRSYDVKLQLRKGYSSDILDEFSTENGRIELSASDDDDGIIDLVTIKFDHEHNQEYPLGILLYDLRIETKAGEYTKLIEGQIRCRASITN